MIYIDIKEKERILNNHLKKKFLRNMNKVRKFKNKFIKLSNEKIKDNYKFDEDKTILYFRKDRKIYEWKIRIANHQKFLLNGEIHNCFLDNKNYEKTIFIRLYTIYYILQSSKNITVTLSSKFLLKKYHVSIKSGKIYPNMFYQIIRYNHLLMKLMDKNKYINVKKYYNHILGRFNIRELLQLSKYNEYLMNAFKVFLLKTNEYRYVYLDQFCNKPPKNIKKMMSLAKQELFKYIKEHPEENKKHILRKNEYLYCYEANCDKCLKLSFETKDVVITNDLKICYIKPNCYSIQYINKNYIDYHYHTKNGCFKATYDIKNKKEIINQTYANDMIINRKNIIKGFKNIVYSDVQINLYKTIRKKYTTDGLLIPYSYIYSINRESHKNISAISYKGKFYLLNLKQYNRIASLPNKQKKIYMNENISQVKKEHKIILLSIML